MLPALVAARAGSLVGIMLVRRCRRTGLIALAMLVAVQGALAAPVGGQLVGLGARGWVAPTSAMGFAGPIGARTATSGAPLGTSPELFQAYVGGAFKGSIMAAEGMFSAGGQSIPYQLLQMTYAL